MDENDSEIDFKTYLEAKENEDFIVKAINSLKFIKSGQVRIMARIDRDSTAAELELRSKGRYGLGRAQINQMAIDHVALVMAEEADVKQRARQEQFCGSDHFLK